MPNDNQMTSLSRPAGRFIEAGYGEQISDGQLLDRFIEQWDQAAFCDLVHRHGPMVLGVCRRILRDTHAAEDAFQATFLLLVRKAGSVRKRGSVGPWLYGVAQRVALVEARGGSSRRNSPARLDPEVASGDDLNELERDELHAALHEELGRLPEKYRAPLVLCYIEGQTHESVARQLGWPIGTVRVRISRGRDLLGTRLIRRGLTPVAVLLALNLLPKTEAAVPARLVEATVQAAARVAAKERMARGEIPSRVVNLERKVRMAMKLTRVKWAASIALAVIVAGAALAIVPRAIAAADDDAKVEAVLKKLQGTWRFVSFEQAGVKKVAEADGRQEEIKIEGQTFAIWSGGHVEEKGKIKLDPMKKPPEIDFQFEEGRHKGKTDLAIYALDADSLKLCWVRDGDKHPKEFATNPDDKNSVLMVLKRQAP
jgi:RNA polymerase sigma factor (sigma-70 family)